MAATNNGLEGIASGTGITTGNSGGASGSAFDVVTLGAGATATSDNTHSAHGVVAAKLAVGGSAADCCVEWTTKIGSQTTIFMRAYYWFGSNPATNHRLFDLVASPNLCGAVYLTTTGKIQSVDTAGGQITITTASVALNQWIRVEAKFVGNATTGSAEIQLYNSADSAVATEVNRSASSFNTNGSFNEYRFGAAGDPLPANRTIWVDEMALSTVDFIGPVGIDPNPIWTPGFMTGNGFPPFLLPVWQRTYPANAAYDVGGVAAANTIVVDTPNGVRAAESPATVAFDLLVADSSSAVRLAESPATAGPATAIADTPVGIRAAESPATTTITVLVADNPSAVRAMPSPAAVTFDVLTADTPSGVRPAQSPATAGSSTFVADTPAGMRAGASPATVVFDFVTTDAPNSVRAAASPAVVTITVLVADAPNGLRLSESPAGAGSSIFAADVASGIRAGSSSASVTFGTVLADTPAAYRLPATTRVGTLTGSAQLDDRTATQTAQLAHQSSTTPVGTITGTAQIG